MTKTRSELIKGLSAAALVVAAVVALLHPATAARLFIADPAPETVAARVVEVLRAGPVAGLGPDGRWTAVAVAGAEVVPGPCLRRARSEGARGEPQAVGATFTCAATVRHPAGGPVGVVVAWSEWRSWLGGTADPRFRPGLRALPEAEARAALARMGLP